MKLPSFNFNKSKPKKQEQFSVAVSIGSNTIEGAVYSLEENAVIRSAVFKLPPGIINAAGDTIADPVALGELIISLMKEIAAPTRNIHLCVPCTLIRVVELPKMEDEEYYISLASEAERFRAFDNTEAIIEFDKLPNASSPVNQRLVYTAMRKDTFLLYHKAIKNARLHLASLNVEPIQVMRGMLSTGMMDIIASHSETPEFCWGAMIHEFDRLRFMVWKGQHLVDIREITMSGQLLSNTDDNTVVLSDLVMELKRTIFSVKPNVPQFWFSHRISYVLLQHLQQELGVTFRSFQLPATFSVDRTDIGMAVVGSAFSDIDSRPYSLNLLDTQSPFQQENGPVSFNFFNFKLDRGFDIEHPEDGASTLRKFMIPSFLGSLGLVLGLWIILWSITLYQENFREQNTESGKQLEDSIVRLTEKVTFYKQSYLLSTKILSVADSSKEVNSILLGLLSDVQYLPRSLWLSEVSYDEQVSITGYALKHKDIVDVTKRFEQRDYGKNFVLHHITEEYLDTTRPIVYNFLLGGMLNTQSEKDTPGINTESDNNVESSNTDHSP